MIFLSAPSFCPDRPKSAACFGPAWFSCCRDWLSSGYPHVSSLDSYVRILSTGRAYVVMMSECSSLPLLLLYSQCHELDK